MNTLTQIEFKSMLSAVVLSLSCYACGGGIPTDSAEPPLGAAMAENGDVYTVDSDSAAVVENKLLESVSSNSVSLVSAVAAGQFSTTPQTVTTSTNNASQQFTVALPTTLPVTETQAEATEPLSVATESAAEPLVAPIDAAPKPQVESAELSAESQPPVAEPTSVLPAAPVEPETVPEVATDESATVAEPAAAEPAPLVEVAATEQTPAPNSAASSEETAPEPEASSEETAPEPEASSEEAAPEPEASSEEAAPEPEASSEEATPEPDASSEEATPEPETSTEAAAPESEASPEEATPDSELLPEEPAPEAGAEAEAGEASLPGEIVVGNNPGDAQCLNLPNNDLPFGGVDTSDWRNWVGSNTLAYAADSENLAVDSTSETRKALRQKLAPASKGSTRSVARAGLAPSKTYRLTQSVYFEPEFDWGGEHEGGKLGFGLGGGSAPTGGLVRTDGFTLRFMWRGNQDGTAHIALYSYAADRSQSLPYGDDYPLVGFDAPVGRWFELAMEVTVNSSTGEADGSVRAWADGQLRVERNNIAWQTSGSQPMVQDLFYTTFYGGNDSSWSPDSTTHVRFSDVCWAPVVDGYSGIDLDSGGTWLANQPSGDYIAEDPTQPILSDDAIALLEQSARNRMANIFFQVELLLPTENNAVDWELFNALGAIDAALDPANWESNEQLSEQSQTMQLLSKAVSNLTSTAVTVDAAQFVRTESFSAAVALTDIAVEFAALAVFDATRQLNSQACAAAEAGMTCSIAALELGHAISELALARELGDDSVQVMVHAQRALSGARLAMGRLASAEL